MMHILLLTFLILALSSCVGTAEELHVNASDSIQDAVNKAHSGDTIIVASGIYNENVDISKVNGFNNLVLMSESNNPADTRIVGKQTDKDVISIKDENTVTIKGFTISEAGTGKAGISLSGGENCRIEHNIFSKDDIGVNIDSSPNSAVSKNVVTGAVNTSKGIVISESNDYSISDNSISNQYLGISIKSSAGGNISGNNVTQSGNHGIVLDGSDSATLERNIVDSVTMFGIYIDESNKNIVRYNTVLNRNNDGNGINLLFSDWNQIIGNTVSLSNHALFMNNSHYNTMQDNIVPDSAYGIAMRYSENNIIVNNSAYNDISGIYLTRYSSNNTISGNKVKSNTQNGIELHLSAHDNILDNNEVSQNQMNGILLADTYNNLVYNNYFNNSENTNVVNTSCKWYLQPPIKGKNIMNGPYLGGNFWATPDGTGFSETASDGDGDGFADTTYTSSDRNVIDKYPLIKGTNPVADFSTNVTGGTVPLTIQFIDLSQNEESRIWDFGDGTNSTEPNPVHTYSTAGTYTVNLTVSDKNNTVSKLATITVQEYAPPVTPVNPVNPVADFNADTTEGYVPLTVQFTDGSQNVAGWNWDFGDGATSTEQNPSHTYSTTGTYTVNLVVNNTNGNSSKTTEITVYEQSHSSGGGGGGGSPEPQSNVEAKELSQTNIYSGNTVKFNFPQKATPLVSINFDSKKTVGKTTTITEMLKAKSTLTSDTPTGEVYKYLNIWVGNAGFATPNNIENAVVSFKVEKSWVQDKKIDKSSITLNRYSDKTWNQLLTTLSSEDDNYLYLTAQTPGFSPFAITGKTTATGTIQPSTGNKTQPAVNGTQTKPNAGSATANVEQNPEQKQSSSTSGNGSQKMPGFDLVCGIVSLLAVFLHKRK